MREHLVGERVRVRVRVGVRERVRVRVRMRVRVRVRVRSTEVASAILGMKTLMNLSSLSSWFG